MASAVAAARARGSGGPGARGWRPRRRPPASTRARRAPGDRPGPPARPRRRPGVGRDGRLEQRRPVRSGNHEAVALAIAVDERAGRSPGRRRSRRRRSSPCRLASGAESLASAATVPRRRALGAIGNRLDATRRRPSAAFATNRLAPSRTQSRGSSDGPAGPRERPAADAVDGQRRAVHGRIEVRVDGREQPARRLELVASPARTSGWRASVAARRCKSSIGARRAGGHRAPARRGCRRRRRGARRRGHGRRRRSARRARPRRRSGGRRAGAPAGGASVGASDVVSRIGSGSGRSVAHHGHQQNTVSRRHQPCRGPATRPRRPPRRL